MGDPGKPSVSIRRATGRDNRLLSSLGAETFFDAFGPDNAPEDMQLYLEASFGPEIQAAELADPSTVFLIADIAGEPAGYVRLREGPPSAPLVTARPIEIVRFYARTRWIGHGVGRALMKASLHEALARDCDVMWLDVWSLNKRAIRFYSQWGFETFGRQPFRLGNDIQEDLLMARPVARPGASSRVLGPDRMDAFASTPRLDLVPVTDSFEPEQLLPVFNSNPEFLTASGYSSQFNRAEIEAYLMEETLAEDALSLLVRLREDGRLIGTVAIQSPNPTDGLPWIGLLLIDSSDQRKGYGAEAAQALEARFAAEGRRAVRLFALRDNEGAKAFWESLGYRAVSESRDAHGREAWLMEKRFPTPP